MPAQEEWRPIPDFPGYLASSLGRIASSKRGKVRLLIGSKSTKGYRQHGLYVNGKRIARSTHVLVATAFHGPRPDGMQVRHLDGDQLHNAADNLAWGSAAENAADIVRHGRNREANKTTCLRGHAFDEPNTYITPGGERRCRACHRQRNRDWKIRQSFRAAGIEVAA